MSITKILIVEGYDDLSFISAIMKNRIKGWIVKPEHKNSSKDKFLVQINICDDEGATGGKAQITYENTLRISKGGYTHVGIVLDADQDFQAANGKAINIINRMKQNYPGVNLSSWIMPTNKDVGMIEDFALTLVSPSQLLSFADSTSLTAQKQPHNAPYKNIHTSKAKLRTWLAWQDEPGIRMGNAAIKGIIDTKSANANAFVDWFSTFFEVEKV